MTVKASNDIWYLGIDFGTLGVSAVLLNRTHSQLYPIYWPKQSPITSDKLQAEMIFRLPAQAYSNPTTSEVFVQLPCSSLVPTLASTGKNYQSNLIQNFKPFLNIGIPYYCSELYQWEPTLQLSGQQVIPLYKVRLALQALLATLTPNSTLPNSEIKIGAVGLESETLVSALQDLEGVIMGTPVGFVDTYHFNLREAALEAKLVTHPEQIFFIADAIAPLLAKITSFNTYAPKKAGGGEFTASSSDPITPWRGGTLVINAGATTTEFALVDLPNDIKDLSYRDLALSSLAYGGNAIDLDIFCQLLYPQLSDLQRQQLALDSDLELPLPGAPDKQKRDRLTFLLQCSRFGQALLLASGYLKLILQHKEEFTLELGSDRWTLQRKDLETKVFLPFVQSLNQQLNRLVIKTGISQPKIYQVFCTGGTTALGTLQNWLRQKLPKASIIQDADSPNGSCVATGLASLPLYPQVLDRCQQQYSDYFLLLEILRTFSKTIDNVTNRLYSIQGIMQQLEHRGLNTGACYERILRLVEGNLPHGLIPSTEDADWLADSSKQNLQYSVLTAQSLFSQESDGFYRINPQQLEYLSQYFELVLSGTHQKLEEPLIVKLKGK